MLAIFLSAELSRGFSFAVTDDDSDTNFEKRRPGSLRELRLEEACNRLAVEAVKRGCTDNVTVMMVDLLHPSSPEL